jgi:hypothetical protein
MRNGNITGYKVYYKESRTSDSLFLEVLTSSTTALISNLTVFTEYDVKAAALTSAGTGVESHNIKVQTEEGGMGTLL